MTAPVVAQLTDLTDRALLILVLERQNNMNAEITTLQNTIAALQAAVAQQGPLIQAAVNLGTQAIAALETLITQVTANAQDAAAITQLATDAASVVTALQSESTQISVGNAALQAELDKIAAPTA